MASAVGGGSARGGGGAGSTGSSRTAGKSASSSSAVAGEHSVCVNVLPPLPLVKVRSEEEKMQYAYVECQSALKTGFACRDKTAHACPRAASSLDGLAEMIRVCV